MWHCFGLQLRIKLFSIFLKIAVNGVVFSHTRVLMVHAQIVIDAQCLLFHKLEYDENYLLYLK